MGIVGLLLVAHTTRLSPWVMMAIVIGATVAIIVVFTVASGSPTREETEQETLSSLLGTSPEAEREDRK